MTHMRLADVPHVQLPFHQGEYDRDPRWQRCDQDGVATEPARIDVEVEINPAYTGKKTRSKPAKASRKSAIIIANDSQTVEDLIAGID